MKKSEFKALIRPLIKECIKESLLEDGTISGIVAEVVKGMNSTPLVESITPAPDPALARMQRNAFTQEESKKLATQKTKLMSAIGAGSYNGVNLFEGTSPGDAPAAPGAAPPSGPLAGRSPQDSGVDISNLFGSVGRNWSAHMNQIKEED
jgi:hypothetical protein